MTIAIMKAAFELRIRGPKKMVLIALADHARPDGRAWPCIARLAHWAGCCERTVQAALLELRKAGLIRLDTTATRLTNTWIVTLPKTAKPPARGMFDDDGYDEECNPTGRCARCDRVVEEEDAPLEIEGCETFTLGEPAAPQIEVIEPHPPQELLSPSAPDAPKPLLEPLEGSKEESSLRSLTRLKEKSVVESDSAFMSFWSVYPRKRDRDDAYKAWSKAIQIANAETIIDGACRYAFSPEAQYQPYAATWLNRKRWQYEADTAPLCVEARAPLSLADGRAQRLASRGLYTGRFIEDQPIGKVIEHEQI